MVTSIQSFPPDTITEKTLRLAGINETLISLEEILQNLTVKAADSDTAANSSSSASGQKIHNKSTGLICLVSWLGEGFIIKLEVRSLFG